MKKCSSVGILCSNGILWVVLSLNIKKNEKKLFKFFERGLQKKRVMWVVGLTKNLILWVVDLNSN